MNLRWSMGVVCVATIMLLGIAVYLGYEGRLLSLTCRSGETTQCVQSYLSSEARWFGLRAAFHTFDAMYARRVMFSSECHTIAHALGTVAYDDYKKSGKIEPLEEYSNCGYGFYHGFMQQLVSNTGDIKKSRELCLTLQEHVSSARDIFSQCLHGFGHGVVAGYAPKVFATVDEYAKAGLEACNDIAEGPEERMYCAGGVYNAIAIEAMDPEFGIDFSKEDPYKICSKQHDPDFREGCFRGVHTMVSYLYQNRFLPAAHIAEKLRPEDAVNALDHLSKYQARNMTESYTDPYIIKMCGLLKVEFLPVCLMGFVKGLVYFVPPNKAPDRGMQFCNDNEFPDDLRGECFRTLASYVNDLSGPQELKRLCNAIPASYTKECTKLL